MLFIIHLLYNIKKYYTGINTEKNNDFFYRTDDIIIIGIVTALETSFRTELICLLPES